MVCCRGGVSTICWNFARVSGSWCPPIACGPSWLIRAVVCATLPAHNAKWHKSCRLLFYPSEFQIVCARKSWIAFGAGKHFRYMAAHELAAAFAADKAKSTRCLPCLCRMWYNIILCRTLRTVQKSAWETWSNFPLVINASLEVYSHPAELSESCLAAIECFVVQKYMTEQASVGLWTTLVSSCLYRKVEHWKTFHQHMMFWCSTASA